MRNVLQTDEVQNFLWDNEFIDEQELTLKHRTICGVPSPIIAQQLVSRRKAKHKLPTYFNTKGIVYPQSLSIEQTSSEIAASFNAELLAQIVGSANREVVDLTGGFGVDTLFLSRRFQRVIYVEPQAELAAIAKSNHAVLGRDNIEHSFDSAENYLNQRANNVGAIYLDPSRRNAGKKVASFRDSVPDATRLLSDMQKITNHILIKASPLLDIQAGMAELSNVRSVTVLAIDNECKELLFEIQSEFDGEPAIRAVNISKGATESYSFTFSSERAACVEYGEVDNFIYEPNAALLKAGAFKSIARQFGIKKLEKHTHLYTSAEMISAFPGKVFRKISQITSSPQVLKEYFPEGKANVIIRNFPARTDSLKKSLKLDDGGDKYLIATTSTKGKGFYVAERILSNII